MPLNHKELLHRTITALKRGDYREAETVLKLYMQTHAITHEIYNLAAVIQAKLGNKDKAIELLGKAILLKPDYVEAKFNLAKLLLAIGQLEQAIALYSSLLALETENAQVLQEVLQLKVQLLSAKQHNLESWHFTDIDFRNHTTKNPQIQILLAIGYFLSNEYSQSEEILFDFFQSYNANLSHLSPKDKRFCVAYHNFLTHLNNSCAERALPQQTTRKIFHIGDSHALSFHGKCVDILSNKYNIVSMLTIGAKAYHFSTIESNKYRSITEKNLKSLPSGSDALISLGEIDCRPDEGFIRHCEKTGKCLETVIAETVNGYLCWLDKLKASQQLNLMLTNVPAPIYRTYLSYEANEKVRLCIKTFNEQLRLGLKDRKISHLDFFTETTNEDGYSNCQFHCDDVHLSSKILESEKSADTFRKFLIGEESI